MKKLKFLITGVTVIAAGSFATYLYFKNIAIKVSSPLNSGQIVPESAIMAAFFHPNQKAITKLQQFGTPEAKKLISQNYAEFQQKNLAEANINWEKDIQSWLGGVMLAFVPGEEGQDMDPVNLLMVVGIKNKLEALRFVSKFKGEGENRVIKRKYQGVTIREITDESRKTFNVAILGDYLAIAPIPAVVESAIDTFQGKSVSLSQNAPETLQQNTELENTIATIFIPNYIQLITQFTDDLPEDQSSSSTGLEQFQQINSVVMGIGVDDAGVRLRAVTKLVSPLPLELTKPASEKILQRFPAETMISLSGIGVSQSWSQLVTQARENQDLQDALGIVRNSFKEVGFDVDREVFSWMDGEFALGLIASNKGILATTGVGAAMVFETSDRSTAEATLKKLNQMASQKKGVVVEEKQIGDQLVTELQMLGIGTFLGYGWLDNNTFFVAMGKPLIEVMMSMPENSLIGSESFEEIRRSLPKSNQGYFYWDIKQSMVWVKRYPFVSVLIPSEVRAILNSIRGIGVTASWLDELTNEMEMLLAL